MIEDAIRTLLLNDATISGKVGTRIFPQVAEQGVTKPYITYTRIGGQHIENSSTSSGLCRARIQIDCFDDNYGDAWTLSDDVRKVMQATASRGAVGSDDINAIESLDDNDTFEQELQGGQNYARRASADYAVWFGETVPA